MPIATFLNKVFQVSATRKNTLNGLTWSGELDTEAQEKLGSKPSTYIKGESLSSLSFDVPLRADFGIKVRAEIESWEAIKSKSKPGIFILGTKPVGKNQWLLKSVGVSDMDIDGRGNISKATLKLEFEEYVRAGQKPPESTGSKSVAIGTTPVNLKPSTYIFDPPDKAAEKRSNPNFERLRERF